MSAVKSSPFIVISTVSSKEEAKKIAKFLLSNQLAACVNIVPKVESVFIWKSKLEIQKELILVIKTEKRKLEKLKSLILKHHSYQVPEIIGWPIKTGHKPYLDWIFKSLRD